MAATQDPQMAGRSWLTARAARLLGHQVPADVDDDEAIRYVPERSAAHRHVDGDCSCGETWPCQFHAPTCPTCHSHDPNHTDPRWYHGTGRDCPDDFHRDADL